MATQTSAKGIDLQKIISGAAELEVKALLAGVEYLQVWLGQAAKLATIANDTLQDIQNEKASLAGTARKLTDFGKQNTEVFADLSTQMSKRYYGELERLASGTSARVETAVSQVRRAARKASTKSSPKTSTKSTTKRAPRRRAASAKKSSRKA
jgi:uncharacterized protein YoxC